MTWLGPALRVIIVKQNAEIGKNVFVILFIKPNQFLSELNYPSLYQILLNFYSNFFHLTPWSICSQHQHLNPLPVMVSKHQQPTVESVHHVAIDRFHPLPTPICLGSIRP